MPPQLPQQKIEYVKQMNLLAFFIRKALGGYIHPMNQPKLELPLKTDQERRIAVVGAGLAGLTAAITLARRGFQVTLFEKNAYLGGKIGAWPTQLPQGETQFVEHGFHAFFRHYYNLNNFLDSLGLRKDFRSIQDYQILALNGSQYRFDGVSKTPVLNLLSMRKTGVYHWGDIVKNPRLAGLASMLAFHPEKTFEKFDEVSYQTWSESLGLPASMRLMFNSFSRAFFATPDRMSTAELLKSFHSFFLSHDGGLIYDYPTGDYETVFLAPLRLELDRLGVKVRLQTPVTELRQAQASEEAGFMVNSEPFAQVVVASDAASTKALMSQTPWPKHAQFRQALGSLRPSQGYAVLRVWLDRPVDPGAEQLCDFIITEHRQILDSITFYHRFEPSAQQWAKKTGGNVLEFHSYALPDGFEESAVIKTFWDEACGYLPHLAHARLVHSELQVKKDFTALHTGLYRDRPGVVTPFSGLVFAGDWVKLPRPAMLMEAAATAGLLAANSILSSYQLREEALFSVPPRGLWAK